MKRILIISPCSGQGAGAEIVLEELLRAWKAEELQLVLLTPAESRIHRVAMERGFEWHDFPIKKDGLHLRDNLWAVKEAYEKIAKCDRVHAWTIRVFPAAAWLSRKWGVPASGTLHDNPFARKIHGPVLWDMRGMDFRKFREWREMVWCTQELVLRTWWRWQWAHRAANHFKQLVCVSEAVHQECVKKGYRCPMTVIRNGLADLPAPERKPSDKVRIGFLGMSRPASKGFSLVEQWIAQVQDDVIWKLYGAASERTLRRVRKLSGNLHHEKHESHEKENLDRINRIDRMQGLETDDNWREGSPERIENMRLSEPLPYAHTPTRTHATPLIDYRGRQSRETIFSEIDILVHPSTTFDSLPTALIEAARAGIPCIASSLGGASEIVKEENSGFLFDSENPVEGLEKLKRLIDLSLREQMGESARRVFEEQFHVERMAEEYRLILA